MDLETFELYWRLLNFTLSVPLLFTMSWIAVKEWRCLPIDSRLYALGVLTLVGGCGLTTLVAVFEGIDFNPVFTPVFSVAGCWLSVATFLRIRRMKRRDPLNDCTT